LNATAVEFARRAKITIHARSTFEPGRESLIRDAVEEASVAVVGQQRIVRARVDRTEAARRALALAAELAIPARDLHADERGASFLLATALSPDWSAARRRLLADIPGLELEGGLGTASVVGSADATALARAIETLEATGLRPLELVQTSGRISAVLPETDVPRAVRALHAAFVGDR
jgi:aspartokinase